MHKYLTVLAALVMGGVLFVIPTAGVTTADSATMVFGNNSVGSGCNFPCEDDASFHAVDKILPGAVSVRSGDTVDFIVAGFHQVAIYDVGTKPKDIEFNGPFPFVNDSDSRIAMGGLTVDFSWTAAGPGKYLVICNIAPHFEEANMWGWVNVN